MSKEFPARGQSRFGRAPGPRQFSPRPRLPRFSPGFTRNGRSLGRDRENVTPCFSFPSVSSTNTAAVPSSAVPLSRPLPLVSDPLSLLTDRWPRKQPRRSEWETRASKTSRVVRHDGGGPSMICSPITSKCFVKKVCKIYGLILTLPWFNDKRNRIIVFRLCCVSCEKIKCNNLRKGIYSMLKTSASIWLVRRGIKAKQVSPPSFRMTQKSFKRNSTHRCVHERSSRYREWVV